MTDSIKSTPRVINFVEERKNRQKNNNKKTENAIRSKDINNLHKVCNKLELQRILDEKNITIQQLIDSCENNDLAIEFLARNIAINSSRQGSKDEVEQIQVCHETAIKYGITIEPLPNDALRPCKNGTIITKQEFKLLKDKNSCLKSFDAEIKGQKNGYVFAKVVYGNGGHQDNVFEEAYTFADWVSNFGNTDLLYVLLIDTDLAIKFEQLKIKAAEQKNLLVVNHVEFQQYIIDNY